MDTKLNDLTALAIEAAFAAGEKILEVYNRIFQVEIKTDGSPLTEADNKSHDIIIAKLHSSQLPILSEEGKSIPYEERKKWNTYWLVDPLDGTKEFIKRNGEFTVNIALMINDVPQVGVIFQPTTGKGWAGIVGVGAYKFNYGNKIFLSQNQKIEFKKNNENLVRVIASRSHRTEETEKFIEDINKNGNKVETINAGSSLKFCLLAEGNADIYPRFAPTMEWDTAAGHAILKAVGRNIYIFPEGNEMPYNKPQLINDWFIAR